ncbi:hypothetical protein HELRODRAFT_91171, partial [Helobdella robusta]|uniref:Fibrinogen C-terminal domain-containing protein n=1 Tax=Helobdella robusta TaxID=6412 RepID=T1G806_HELRO
EKMHQLTNSAEYRLRFEVLIRGVWYSDEYVHFKINSEFEKYSINVSGYSGDKANVLNSPYSNVVHNGMKFTTYDQDNDLAPFNCGLQYASGNWFNWCGFQKINQEYGSYYFYYVHSPTITYCRMMMKRNA